jgi:hypothetical protein
MDVPALLAGVEVVLDMSGRLRVKQTLVQVSDELRGEMTRVWVDRIMVLTHWSPP